MATVLAPSFLSVLATTGPAAILNPAVAAELPLTMGEAIALRQEIYSQRRGVCYVFHDALGRIIDGDSSAKDSKKLTTTQKAKLVAGRNQTDRDLKLDASIAAARAIIKLKKEIFLGHVFGGVLGSEGEGDEIRFASADAVESLPELTVGNLVKGAKALYASGQRREAIGLYKTAVRLAQGVERPAALALLQEALADSAEEKVRKSSASPSRRVDNISFLTAAFLLLSAAANRNNSGNEDHASSDLERAISILQGIGRFPALETGAVAAAN